MELASLNTQLPRSFWLMPLSRLGHLSSASLTSSLPKSVLSGETQAAPGPSFEDGGLGKLCGACMGASGFPLLARVSETLPRAPHLGPVVCGLCGGGAGASAWCPCGSPAPCWASVCGHLPSSLGLWVLHGCSSCIVWAACEPSQITGLQDSR